MLRVARQRGTGVERRRDTHRQSAPHMCPDDSKSGNRPSADNEGRN